MNQFLNILFSYLVIIRYISAQEREMTSRKQDQYGRVGGGGG